MLKLKLDNCILLSKNNWANNKLCIKKLKKCFEFYTKSQLYRKYLLWIIDNYASHVLTEFIFFTLKYKIICLCLLLYLTQLLQYLDICIFSLLKQNYKKLQSEKTCFSTHNINKTNFIFLIL